MSARWDSRRSRRPGAELLVEIEGTSARQSSRGSRTQSRRWGPSTGLSSVLSGAEDRQLELGILGSMELQVLQRIMDSGGLVALQRVHDAQASEVLAVTGGQLASPRLYLLAIQAAAAAVGAVAMV